MQIKLRVLKFYKVGWEQGCMGTLVCAIHPLGRVWGSITWYDTWDVEITWSDTWDVETGARMS